jgi:signal peptidase II
VRSGRSVGAALAVAVLALASDQLTKIWARSAIEPGESIDLLAGVQLVRIRNEGIAFGLLDGIGAPLILLAAAVFAGLLVFFLLAGERDRLWLPVGLLAGGAAGNLLDRLLDGGVTDFVDPPAWPAFNLADVQITVGVVLLLLLYLRPEPDPGSGEEPAGGAR